MKILSKLTLAFMLARGALGVAGAQEMPAAPAPGVPSQTVAELAPEEDLRRLLQKEIAQRDSMAAKVVVYKAQRRLELFDSKGELLRVYNQVALGFRPLGDKRWEFDGRTPEGEYFIDARNPKSSYYLSVRISYPNAGDIAAAAEKGWSPGKDIFIHGQPNGKKKSNPKYQRGKDWTNGCVGLQDAEMDEVWKLTGIGTPVLIKP